MADADVIDMEDTSDALFVFIVVRQKSSIPAIPDMQMLVYVGTMVLLSCAAGNTRAQSASVRLQQGGQGHLDEPPESA